MQTTRDRLWPSDCLSGQTADSNRWKGAGRSVARGKKSSGQYLSGPSVSGQLQQSKMRFRFISLAVVFVLILSCRAGLAHSLTAPSQVDRDVVKGKSIPNATFMVTSSPAPLPFEITSSSSFFTISVSRNTTPATVTIQFDQSVSANLGELTGSISISMPELLPEYDLRQTVEVRLLVRELGAPPLIRTNRDSFLFTATTSTPVADPPALFISNGGGETLSYSLAIEYATGGPKGWLDISPTTGTTSTGMVRHSFSFSTSSLPPGNYAAKIKITGNTTNSPKFVSVDLAVTEPPLLAPNPFQLDLRAIAGRNTEGVSKFQIQNLGGGSATYLMTLAVPWLKIVPLQETVADDPIEHVVRIDATGMSPGSYSTVVPIQSLTPGVPNDSLLVNLTLTEPPVLDVSPSNVSLNGVAGSEAVVEGVIMVTSELASALNWTAQLQADQPWLQITPAGSAPGVLRLRANASALQPGVYTTEISFSAQASGPGGTSYPNAVRVPVTLTVAAAAPSNLLLSRQTTLFESSQDGLPSPQTFSIRSSGAELSWSVETNGLPPWLTLSANQGSTPALVELSADPQGLGSGLYSDTFEVISGASRKKMSVVLAVSGGSADLLQVAPRGLAFRLETGSTKTLSAKLWATNHDADAVNWNIVFGNGAQPAWLSLPALSGTAPAGESIPIEVRVNAAGLQAGEYSSLLRVDTQDGASRFVTVIFRVTAPGGGPQPTVSPAGLVLQSAAGTEAAVNAEIQLAEVSGLAAQFQAAAATTAPWLSLSQNQGQVAAGAVVSLTVTANPAGLAASAHRGEIVVDFTNGKAAVIPVLFLIRSPAASAGPAQNISACADETLFANLASPAPGFEAQTGFPFPLELEIKNSCGEGVTGLSPSIEFSSSEPSITLQGRGDGSYVGAWTPQNPVQQVTAGVVLPGAEPVAATGRVVDAGRARISRGGVVNGADFVPRQTLAPGGIVSLFGDDLVTTAAYASQTPLATALSQTSVLVDGAASPLFAVFPQQINLQVPYETAAERMVDVVVLASNRFSVPERLAVVESQPGIFELPVDFDGPNRAAAINQDGTINSTANPAASGSVVTVFLTGQGPLNRSVSTGVASPSDPNLARASLESKVTLNGQPAQLEFLGLTPGYVGLLQANVRLGQVAANDAEAELAIQVGDYESVPLLISIKP